MNREQLLALAEAMELDSNLMSLLAVGNDQADALAFQSILEQARQLVIAADQASGVACAECNGEIGGHERGYCEGCWSDSEDYREVKANIATIMTRMNDMKATVDGLRGETTGPLELRKRY